MATIHTLSDSFVLKGEVLTAITAATNTPTTAVDTLGYRRAAAYFNSAPTGTGTTSACKLQDSPDNSTFTDVTNAAFTTVTTVNAAAGTNGMLVQWMNIDLSKRNRYLRLVHTGAGGSAAGVAAAGLVLYEADYAGVTNDQTAITV